MSRPSSAPGSRTRDAQFRVTECHLPPGTQDAVRPDVLFEDEEFADLYPDDGGPGLSPGHVLCEFRARLSEQDGAAHQLLELMLDHPAGAGLLKAGGRQCADAPHVPAAARNLSRLEPVGETLRAALEELADGPRLAGAADRARVGRVVAAS